MEELRELLLMVTIKCNNIEEVGCGIYNRPEEFVKRKNRAALVYNIRQEIKKLDEALNDLNEWDQKG